MEMNAKYKQVFAKLSETVSARKEKGIYTALGYTSNLDYLCDFRTERLNELIAQHLPTLTLDQVQKYDCITNVSELLQTIIYYCIKGIGGEASIPDPNMLAGTFTWRLGMGGTGVQAAMALAMVGCESVVHLTDCSHEVCQILNLPEIFTVDAQGRLIHTKEAADTGEQEVHCIIQFKKGDCICLGEEQVPVPVSNRLILANMTINTKVPFSKPFFEYVEKQAAAFSSIVLSSFNEISDMSLLKQHLEFVKTHVKAYRGSNPAGKVFFEDAHYHSPQARKLCRELLYPEIDILSLNEDELLCTLTECGIAADIEDIISCVAGVHRLKEMFGIRQGIIVHTKDYSMCVGEVQAARIEEGLIYGNLISTAKALNGTYGNLAETAGVLELPLSQVGVNHQERIRSSPYAGEVVLVPTKYLEKPQYTIGLGDSFVAGVQLCFEN